MTEIDTMPIVIGIPRNAVKLTVTADIYDDGEICTAESHLTMTDIQDLRYFGDEDMEE